MTPSRTPMAIKTLRLIPAYIRLSLQRTTEFKFNFYTYLGVYLFNIGLYVFFWTQVGNRLPVIEGWDVPAYVMLTAFGALNFGLQDILWATGMLDVMILNGDLLVVLSRPENSYFGMVFRRLSVMSLLPIMMGLTLLGVTIVMSDIDLDFLRLFMALLACLCGAVTFRCLLLCVGALSFRYGRMSAFKSLVFTSREVSRFPLSVYPRFAVTFFVSVFPVMLLTTWPVMILNLVTLERALLLLLASLAITAFWIGVSSLLWVRGLKDYEGLAQWA